MVGEAVCATPASHKGTGSSLNALLPHQLTDNSLKNQQKAIEVPRSLYPTAVPDEALGSELSLGVALATAMPLRVYQQVEDLSISPFSL